jgi:hypothetical protein
MLSDMMSLPKSILQQLLGTLSVDDFFDEIFESHHHHTEGSGLFRDFNLKRFEELLWAHEALIDENIDINKDGQSFYYKKAEAGKDPFRWTLDRYIEGCTVILNGVGDIDLAVAEIIRPLDRLFKGRTTANAFLTPPGSRGFLPHFDTHDVFIVQTSGNKTWRLYDKELPLPVDNQIYLISQDTLGEPVAEYQLRPGEVLYIPRGMVHGAFTTASHSLHITIGIRPFLRLDYLHKLLDTLAEKDEAFRKSLLDYSSPDQLQAIKDLIKKMEDGSENPYLQKLTVERIDAVLASQSKPMPGHHFENIETTAAIGLHTKVAKASSQNDALVESGDQVRLLFAGSGFVHPENPKPGYLEFPMKAYGALRFIVENEEAFCADDLPDFYPGETKLLVVRKLFQEGYLRQV